LFVESVEVDLEDAAWVRLVVRMVVEVDTIDLDGPVVASGGLARAEPAVRLNATAESPSALKKPPIQRVPRLCIASPP